MIVVIGGGVVGLAAGARAGASAAVACACSSGIRGRAETSTHNSGVIHAGLYYPAGSLKARLCVEGRERLYAFCERAGVPHVRCGKLIVARRGGRACARSLIATAAAQRRARSSRSIARSSRAREPHVAADAALWSPDTGWVEAEALRPRARGRAGARTTASLLVGTAVTAHRARAGRRARRRDAARAHRRRRRRQRGRPVRRRGLGAWPAASRSRSIRAAASTRSWRRARAISCAGSCIPCRIASGHGLGVHLTRTLGGAVWIGPTIRYQDDKTDYERDRLPLEAFLEPTRALLPAVTLDDLRLGGSGIRAKLHPPSGALRGFPDSARRARARAHPRRRHRLAGADGVPRDRRARGRGLGRESEFD